MPTIFLLMLSSCPSSLRIPACTLRNSSPVGVSAVAPAAEAEAVSNSEGGAVNANTEPTAEAGNPFGRGGCGAVPLGPYPTGADAAAWDSGGGAAEAEAV